MEVSEATPASIQPRKEPVQARSRERFQRILDVAVSLISSKGVDAVAMSEIAAEAKISIASLYQYFPDKAAIIATLADRYNAEGRACVHDVFAKVKEPADMAPAMHAMIDSYYEFFCSVPGSRAIWQASQSDRRLQEVDAEDMKFHAQTLCAAFKRIRPELSDQKALQLGRIFTDIIGTSVRTATDLDQREGQELIDMCKEVVLTPAVEQALATN